MKPSIAKGRAEGSQAARTSWGATGPLLAALALAVVLPRLVVMQVSVVDWDESFYALIAQQWVAGHVPYATVFDHKPIGLYAIFATFFLAFGDSILAIRLIALAFVAGTAVMLARTAEAHFGRHPWLGAWAAALYGLASLANGGLATNTEILINFFIVLGLWIIVSAPRDAPMSIGRCLAAGASLGTAFQVNYLAGILVAGVAAFYLCWIADVRPAAALLRRYVRDGSLMLLGFLATWLVLLTPVLFASDIRDYFGLQFAYLTGYESPASMSTVLRRISEVALAWWPLFTLALALAIGTFLPGIRDRRITGWLIMLGFGLAAASASGYFYHHFFLFALPALVMLAMGFLCLVLDSGNARAWCAAWLLLMAGSSVLAAQETMLRGLRAHIAGLSGGPPDTVAAVGDYLSRRLAPGDTIFVFEDQPILYFLTRTTPPSRFAFPDYYTYEPLARRFGTSSSELLDHALDTHPRFVVAGPVRGRFADSKAVHEFYARLGREYAPASAEDPAAPSIVYEPARRPEAQ